MAESELCHNCGTHLAGKFCHVCGQKKIEDKERTVRHFFYQFFGAAFFLENNFIKNLWYLLTRPGFLPAEYLAGRRKRYMTPISLFLLINLVYFLAVGLTDFNLSLRDQLRQPHHVWLVPKLVDNRLAQRNIKLEEYEAVYNNTSNDFAKSLIILNVPVMALFLTLIYWRKKLYFTDHMVHSFYLIGFVLLYLILSYAIFVLFVRLSLISPGVFFSISGYLMMTVLSVYFFFSLKRFYLQNFRWTLFMTVLVILCFLVTHFIYRSILFFTIFWIT